MDQRPEPTHQNRLLRLLEPGDRAALAAHLEPVKLDRGDVLTRPHKPIERIVFPESGIVSVVSIINGGHLVEVGIFGREGMTGGSLLVGVDRVPYQSFVQVRGNGYQIGAGAFVAVTAERPAILQTFQRYAYLFSIQVAQTALSNSINKLEERLARWLLMCQDRVDGDELHFTHEFLGTMLAVRRSGVTEATQKLEASGIISAKRGRITILDRQALIGMTDISYGVAEAEYERVMGPTC